MKISMKSLVATSILFLIITFVFLWISFIIRRSGMQINPLESIRNGNVHLSTLLLMLPVAGLGYMAYRYKSTSNEIVTKWKEGSAEIGAEYTAQPSQEAVAWTRRCHEVVMLAVIGTLGVVTMLIVYFCRLPMGLSVGVILCLAGGWYVFYRLEMAKLSRHGLVLLRDSKGTYLIHKGVDAYQLANVEKAELTEWTLSTKEHRRYRYCILKLVTKSVLTDIPLGMICCNTADVIALFDKADIAVEVDEKKSTQEYYR